MRPCASGRCERCCRTRRRGARAAAPDTDIPDWLRQAFLCIHSYEGGWTSNTGNGYYGGLQMDWGFMRTYGPSSCGNGARPTTGRSTHSSWQRRGPTQRDAASRRGRTPPAPAACSSERATDNPPAGSCGGGGAATLRNLGLSREGDCEPMNPSMVPRIAAARSPLPGGSPANGRGRPEALVESTGAWPRSSTR